MKTVPIVTTKVRINRMERGLDAARAMYGEVLTIAGPRLDTEEGKELLQHCSAEEYAAWRLVHAPSSFYGI